MTQANLRPDDPAATTIAASTSSPALDRYERETLENVRRHLPIAWRQLQDAGVHRVHIDYDGCGDSGCIESITYVDAQDTPIDLRSNSTISKDELMDLFYDLIQVRHPGWENNDGACGEFCWSLADDALTHTHNARYTDYDTTELEGL